jgi:hypothetical protein
MLGNIVRRIRYGRASEIDLDEVRDLVGNLDNVDFQMRQSQYHCNVSELPRLVSEGEENPTVELSIHPNEFQSQVLKMKSVSGSDVLIYLPGNDTLIVDRLEYRSRSNGITTQHHLWIERGECDPVINPRQETYHLSGVSRDTK